eukprot:jgi/Orpsp1_1/1184233/evm.model.c7180000088642.1
MLHLFIIFVERTFVILSLRNLCPNEIDNIKNPFQNQNPYKVFRCYPVKEKLRILKILCFIQMKFFERIKEGTKNLFNENKRFITLFDFMDTPFGYDSS